MKTRLSQPFGDFLRIQRASRQRTTRNDQRTIGVPDVCGGAFAEICGFRFAKVRVSLGNPAELIDSPERNPAAARNSKLECDIQRCSIDPGLSAGHNPVYTQRRTRTQ